MYKLLFILYLLMGAPLLPKAKTSIPKVPVKVHQHSLQIDSSNVKVRNFNPAELNKYLKDPEFNYSTDIKKQSLWNRFWEWLWRVIENLFSSSNSSGSHSASFINYLLLIALVAVLVYVVVKMIGISNIFNKNSQQINIPYAESLQNIHEITFEQEIEKALTRHNYRLAVRLLYLQCLKQLSDAQLIHWQIEKTNAAYLSELANTGQRQIFAVLTKQFEYVWYGDFPLDGESFQNINALFADFKKILP